MSWRVSILTLFPELFPGPLASGVVGKALETGKWQLDTHNIRNFAKDNYQSVDDKPFGGGSGMVMRADILAAAIDTVKEEKTRLVYMSPRGKVFTQKKASELVKEDHLAIICGRYEGVDERVIEAYDIEEISVGDYILSGGEIPAFAVIDTCVRQLSGVLGNEAALDEESFGPGIFSGLLEYPQYTRPSSWRGRDVPAVLLSGNHLDIEQWRLKQAEKVTKTRREDMWKQYSSRKNLT